MNENLLSGASDTLANQQNVGGTIVPVSIETVVGADPSENVAGRTVQQVRTNHQITVSDRLGLYQTKGWHGLGEVIEDGLSGEDAVRKYLPWSVERVQSFVTIDGKARPLPVWANVRSDTRDILGLVGPEFQTVQNLDLGRFTDAIVGADSSVRMETCGSLLGGRKVFLLVRVPREVRVGKTGSDVTVPYLLIANGHDGKMALTALWTMDRVVCNNTYTRALGAVAGSLAEGTAFRIRHTGDVASQLDEARKVLGIAAKGLTQYEAQAKALAAAERPASAIDDYFRSVFECEFGAKPEDDLDATAWEIRRDKVVAEWRTIFDSETCTFDGIGGTLWAAVNAVTQWVDRDRSKGVKGDRRQHLNLIGRGASAKRDAMRLALAAV